MGALKVNGQVGVPGDKFLRKRRRKIADVVPKRPKNRGVLASAQCLAERDEGPKATNTAQF
jgi:hypothetical protein